MMMKKAPEENADADSPGAFCFLRPIMPVAVAYSRLTVNE